MTTIMIQLSQLNWLRLGRILKGGIVKTNLFAGILLQLRSQRLFVFNLLPLLHTFRTTCIIFDYYNIQGSKKFPLNNVHWPTISYYFSVHSCNIVFKQLGNLIKLLARPNGWSCHYVEFKRTVTNDMANGDKTRHCSNTVQTTRWMIHIIL